MQTLKCSHNIVKHIPSTISHLSNLRHLDLSRNQLSTVPIAICRLQSLELLLLASNRLVSIPEEISMLQKLTELDVSCNQLTCLPVQLSELKSLRVLNLRHNLLLEIPVELYRLQLRILDLSRNKLTFVPHQYQLMNTLEELRLDDNPLNSPPANLCGRGLDHVMKFLLVESKKEARRRGSSSGLAHPEGVMSPELEHRVRFVGGVRCDVVNGIGPTRPESGYGTSESLHTPAAADTRSGSSSSFSSTSASTSMTATPSSTLRDNDSTSSQDLAPDEFSRQLERARTAYASEKRRASQIKVELARKQQQQQQQQLEANSNNNNSSSSSPAGPSNGGTASSKQGGAPQAQFSSSQTVLQRLEAQLQRGQRAGANSPAFSTLQRLGRSASAGHAPSPDPQPSNGTRGWTPSSRSVDPAVVRSASKELRLIIESRLKIRLPEEVGSALRDGVILCHLVNQLQPRSIYSVHVPSPGQPMLGLAKCRRNVENFLEACRRLGVPESRLFSINDVVESSPTCLPRLAVALNALLDVCQKSLQSEV